MKIQQSLVLWSSVLSYFTSYFCVFEPCSTLSGKFHIFSIHPPLVLLFTSEYLAMFLTCFYISSVPSLYFHVDILTEPKKKWVLFCSSFYSLPYVALKTGTQGRLGGEWKSVGVRGGPQTLLLLHTQPECASLWIWVISWWFMTFFTLLGTLGLAYCLFSSPGNTSIKVPFIIHFDHATKIYLLHFTITFLLTFPAHSRILYEISLFLLFLFPPCFLLCASSSGSLSVVL